MPKTTRSGKADQEKLPSTLQRSPVKAQRTFAKVHDAAAEQYGDSERAHRTAYAALKHFFKKVGDSWEPKDHKGPSDARSEQSGKAARDSTTATAGGLDAHASKKHLYEIAQRLDVPGRSPMTKDELVTAIGRANDRASSNARKR